MQERIACNLIQALGNSTRVSSVLIEIDGDERDYAPRSDAVLNLNESSEKVGSQLTQLEQLVLQGGVHNT